MDGDEDLEQDETRNDAGQTKDLLDMDTNLDEPPSKVPSPKPQLMMLQSSADDETQDPTELDASLKPVDNGKEGHGVESLELDISGLVGPDGLQLENTHDLSQLDGPDGLIGGPLIDDSIDPFASTA